MTRLYDVRRHNTMLAWHLRLSLFLAVTLIFGIVGAKARTGGLSLTKEEIKNVFSDLFKTSTQIAQQLRLSDGSVSTDIKDSLDNITSAGGQQAQRGAQRHRRAVSCGYGLDLEWDKCWSTCRTATTYYSIGSWYIVHFPPLYQFATVASCAPTSTSPYSCSGSFVQHVEQTFLVSSEDPATTYGPLYVALRTQLIPYYCRCYY